MRCLNEYIARWANAEDGCTGRCWEGRFKSQVVLDETALITAMAYVNVNPIRAGLATSLADREKTSVKQRLEMVTRPSSGEPTIRLMPFSRTVSDISTGLPFKLQDYLGLVVTT